MFPFDIRQSRVFLTAFVAGMWLAASSFGAAADEQETPRVWVGTWTNRKYNTSGPLKCTATKKDDSTAEAKFEGTFMKDPFGYTVKVNMKQEKNQATLEGTAELDGDRYQWSGYVRGKILYGQFRSLKGNTGEIWLEEATK